MSTYLVVVLWKSASHSSHAPGKATRIGSKFKLLPHRLSTIGLGNKVYFEPVAHALLSGLWRISRRRGTFTKLKVRQTSQEWYWASGIVESADTGFAESFDVNWSNESV
ncbi:MAG: hypothetical protein R2684_12615 [Pyrinomonadaceae bacterium]